jgi:hypothetical protein
VHEEPLTRLQTGLAEERVVRGREDLGEAAGVLPVEDLGDRHRLALVDDGELRLAPAADDRHDPVALVEASRARPPPDDLACELEPGDVGRLAGRRRIAPAPLQHVRSVDARRLDADQDLAVAGLGIRALLGGQLAVDDRCGLHGGGS